MLQIILFGLQEAVKAAPGIVNDIGEILSHDNPTPADWDALRVKVASKDYFDYVPDSKLKPAEPSPPVEQ